MISRPLVPTMALAALRCMTVATIWFGILPAVEDDPVRVHKVVLFSSGVGYFEHDGSITGNATCELNFTAEQLNDLLKSLVLEDLNGGHVGSVEYPSLDPIAKTLASFEVDISGNPSLADLLSQLRGAEVVAVRGADTFTGTVLGVESHVVALSDTNDRTEQVWELNLLTDGAVRQLHLGDISSLTFTDKKLQDELTKALGALSQARNQDKKPIQIHFDGQGQREVRVGYVIETPVWKTSYRLILPDRAGGNGQLQGWAIVENQTDEDWTGISLSLVSGRPISFIENLSQPLYVPRPVVEPDLFASLRPQNYDGGMAARDGAVFGERKAGGRQLDNGAAIMAMAGAPAAPAAQASTNDAYFAAVGSAQPMDVTRSIQAAAQADQLGGVTSFTVPSVTLPRQRSAMLPIVTAPVAIEAVSIFNAQALANHPLVGALITNTTGNNLLQGPVTVLDAKGYRGDATIDNLPPGDHRLISFAIDIPVKADATSQNSDRTIASGSIIDGILQLSVKQVNSQTYQFDNGATDDRVIVIEHPLMAGWDLTETVAPFEKTATLYRWKLPVPAGKSADFTVKQQQIQSERYAILDMDLPSIDVYLKNGAISKTVKDALGKAAALRDELATIQRAIDDHKTTLASIAEDQNRIRENMQTVQQTSQLYQRLESKLNAQETDVETKQKELDDLQTSLEMKRQVLNDYLSHLNLQ